METIGGVAIETYRFTRALGVNPASASGVAIGDPGLSVGDYVAYQFGSIIFYGIVTSVRNRITKGGGSKYHFEVVDNRIRLQWQIVKGMWNIEMSPSPGNGARVDADASQWSHAGGGGGSDNVDPGLGAPPLGSVPGVGGIADPGADPARRRRYGHILPPQWASQLMTYTDDPLTAAEVLSSAFNGADGDYGFNRAYHSSQLSDPVLSIDANNGMVLSNLVAEVTSRQGLSMEITGSRSLRWWRKGEGVFIPPLSVSGQVATCMESLGMELSRVPTSIHVIGDRTLVQFNEVAMEPDWASGWELWISEVDFVRKVGVLLNLDVDTAAGLSERAARAREITVAQFIVLEGEDDAAYVDYGRWGEVSRMDIPAWVYINEIVFRSYRIPRDFDLYGIPLDSLKIGSSLLAAVEKTGTGAGSHIRYRREPEEMYPSTKAFCMARGQPLDLVDERSMEAFVKARSTDMRADFSEVTDFEVDDEGYSVRFKSPVFLDGDPAEGESIFLYPNKGEGSYVDASVEAEDTDLLNVVVPNPDYVVGPAEVRMSIVFAMGKWEKLYGSGPRRGVHYAHDLALHCLDMSGDSGFSGPQGALSSAPALRVPNPPGGSALKQILYTDGESVEERSDAIAASQIAQSASVLSGNYVRHGAAGQQLSGIVDRVTIVVSKGGGISENIELTKERPTGGFQAEHEVVSRQRSQEMFPGQWELQKEVRQLRQISRLQRQTSSDTRPGGAHKKIFDLGARPIGDDSVSTVVLENGAGAIAPNGVAGTPWQAGHVIFLDAAGKPSLEGTTFGGVLVKGQPSEETAPEFTLPAAHRGVVPVIVQGPFGGGDLVGVDKGESFGRVDGAKYVGKLEHAGGYVGTEKVVAMVRLGGGGASGSRLRFEVKTPVLEPVSREWRTTVGEGWFFHSHVLLDIATPVEEGQLQEVEPVYEGTPKGTPITNGFAVPGPGDPPLPNPLPKAWLTILPTCWVYLHWKTDPTGVLKKLDDPKDDFVEVLVSAERAASEVHSPHDEDFSNEVYGDYYLLLAQFEPDEEDATKPVRVGSKKGYASDVFWTQHFSGIENRGTGVNLYMEYHRMTDKNRLRSLKGRYGLSVAKHGVPAETILAEVELKNWGVGEEIWAEPFAGAGVAGKEKGGTVDIRKIRGGTAADSEPDRHEITVVLNPDGDPEEDGENGPRKFKEILVRGNNYQKDLVVAEEGAANFDLVQVKDGLVSAINGSLKLIEVDVCEYDDVTGYTTVVAHKFITYVPDP